MGMIRLVNWWRQARWYFIVSVLCGVGISVAAWMHADNPDWFVFLLFILLPAAMVAVGCAYGGRQRRLDWLTPLTVAVCHIALLCCVVPKEQWLQSEYLALFCLRLPARRPSAAGSAVLPACRTAGACGRVGVSSGALSFVCPRESAPVSGAICGIWRAFGPAAAGMRAADCVCDAPRLAPRVCGSAVLDMFVQFFQRAASVAVHQPGQLERGADASRAPRPCSTLHNVCSGLLEAASPGVSQGRCSVNSRAYMIEYG